MSAHSEEDRFFCFLVQAIELVFHLQRGAQNSYLEQMQDLCSV